MNILAADLHFIYLLMPQFKTKRVQVRVLLKANESSLLKPRFHKEIEVHKAIIRYHQVDDFYYKISRNLHMYPELRIHWKDVNYLVFEYEFLGY